MKYIIAIIKPFKLEEVREALGAIGVTYTYLHVITPEVKACPREKKLVLQLPP